MFLRATPRAADFSDARQNARTKKEAAARTRCMGGRAKNCHGRSLLEAERGKAFPSSFVVRGRQTTTAKEKASEGNSPLGGAISARQIQAGSVSTSWITRNRQ